MVKKKKIIVRYMCPIFCLEKIVTPVFVLLHDLNSQVPPHQSREGKKNIAYSYSYSFSVISLKAAAVINRK